MFLTDEKQKEVRELFAEVARNHIGREYGYQVEFFEQGENTLTKFSILKDSEEILNIQNLMTPQGFKDLEDRKGWTAWVVEHAELMKKLIIEKAAKTKKNRLSEFLDKIYRKWNDEDALRRFKI